MKRCSLVVMIVTIVFVQLFGFAFSESSFWGDYTFEQSTIAMTTARVNLRNSPFVSSDSLIVIPKNTVLKVVEQSPNWIGVIFEGDYGYINADYLKLKVIQDAYVLGVYTTFFSTSQKGRTKNIKKAADLINSYVIEPHKTFSLLDAIGPINKENGYFEAPEFKRTSEGTETVMGYGGGVCQVATTLYQAFCLASYSSSLSLKERHTHSKSVSYIEDGQDATISWKAKQDLKWKNDNNYPIMIMTYVHNGALSCMILRI